MVRTLALGRQVMFLMVHALTQMLVMDIVEVVDVMLFAQVLVYQHRWKVAQIQMRVTLMQMQHQMMEAVATQKRIMTVLETALNLT